MDPRTQERVEEWDSRQFSGGFDGLSDLADANFSGAVSAVGTWLFMLNGRIIGVIDGDIEDFETASGTRYEAPDPSLPLLCTMEERGGETRAKYYTNETPLREVDGTLQSGSFTGYIELSENVLSGDYYAVYYGGRRMAAAYIGNAERLLTGDEAFDRAADEVGIYEVRDVEIEVTDVPGTEATSTSDATDDRDASSAAGSAGAGTTTSESTTDADASADPTASSIEPIDVSSTDPVGTGEVAGGEAIEDVTADDESSLMSDIDLTDDPTGITTTDETETDTESVSDGITEAEPSVDPTSDSIGTDAGSDARAQDVIDQAEQGDDIAGASVIEEASESSSDDPAVATDTTPATDDRNDSSTSTAAASAEADSDVTDPDETAAGTDTETTASSSPDLEEIEAAAEELAENDITWVDDDDEDENAEGSTDEPATDADTDTEPENADPDPDAEDGDLEEQFEREEAWRETRRIPSIDPDNSEPTASSDSSAGGRDANASRSASVGSESASTSTSTGADSRSAAQTTGSTATSSGSRSERSETQPRRQESDRTRTGASSGDRGSGSAENRVAALTEKVETLQEQREALAAKTKELESERDRLRSENDELSSTVERLQSRIEELETELKRERARERDAAGGAEPEVRAGTQLAPEQALSGTNLFVRYASKSKPTLETAHDGAANRSEVASNIRLEHHTQFDSADTAVDGEPYEEFLTSTMEYRFVNWLTEMVLYEIRDTGNADALADLYDAIPRIDRAELGATISLADDDTEDVPDQVTFDIVAFDKMGNPLLLVTLSDSREPASKELLAELEEAASAVKANYPDLAAAIAVTSSYFEPGALEVAEQATSGGFLSRGSKLSYVNLSRKEGYHLCLVESRSEGFHMNVPEL
ncbi:cell division protein ZapB [Natrinema salaciae]|uniref:DUF7527 domain-containing protein n=1 Tax=Natrinema salaciae TaxID=1186196 RepID=A0A1H9GPI7_9EURY|nr:cell division protein ZapB [Natrinema salaciae]SEQ52057.1 hypothetical protein SAMN04489841_1955 [Natrinema salaciae]